MCRLPGNACERRIFAAREVQVATELFVGAVVKRGEEVLLVHQSTGHMLSLPFAPRDAPNALRAVGSFL
jgi:hypothetical protein